MDWPFAAVLPGLICVGPDGMGRIKYVQGHILPSRHSQRRPIGGVTDMPYPADHKHEVRIKILDSARRLFNRNGLTEISIDEIMAGADLTRGGFYSYFPSKENLYAEAIIHFLNCQAPIASWQHSTMQALAEIGPADTRGKAQAVLDAYLSRDHLDDVDNSCPMVGLATDVARVGAAAKAAYRQVLSMMVSLFAENLGPDAFAASEATSDQASDRHRALAVVSMCVGGMVLARAVDDPVLAEDLRTAAHRYAVALAGWHRTSV
jgi:AcrR family transcriptional regulator